MTDTERVRLEELEERMRLWTGSHLNEGMSLEAIRDERLYREFHATFDEYLRDVWGSNRRRIRIHFACNNAL